MFSLLVLIAIQSARPDLAHTLLLLEIWIVPGVAVSKIVQVNDAWNGRTCELRQAVPLLITGAIALVVAGVT